MPSIPGWITIAIAGAIGLLTALQGQALPAWATSAIGIALPLLVYVGHLLTSKTDAKKIAAGAFPGKAS